MKKKVSLTVGLSASSLCLLSLQVQLSEDVFELLKVEEKRYLCEEGRRECAWVAHYGN